MSILLIYCQIFHTVITLSVFTHYRSAEILSHLARLKANLQRHEATYETNYFNFINFNILLKCIKHYQSCDFSRDVILVE